MTTNRSAAFVVQPTFSGFVLEKHGLFPLLHLHSTGGYRNGKRKPTCKDDKVPAIQQLLTLLQKKPLSRITVKEICEGADVNRSTYYAYYADPYDQLNQMVQTFLQEQTV